MQSHGEFCGNVVKHAVSAGRRWRVRRLISLQADVDPSIAAQVVDVNYQAAESTVRQHRFLLGNTGQAVAVERIPDRCWQAVEIRKLGGCADAAQCDVRDDHAQQAIFAAHVQRHGGLDAAVLNAGIFEKGTYVANPVTFNSHRLLEELFVPDNAVVQVGSTFVHLSCALDADFGYMTVAWSTFTLR